MVVAEKISYTKFQTTEPARRKVLKRGREEQGLAMADVRSKWKGEDEGICMRWREAEEQTRALLRPSLAKGQCWC